MVQVLKHHQLLLSASVLQELADKCNKHKFRRYFSVAEGLEFIALLEKIGEQIVVWRTTTACRDSKDNMFLDLALSGGADLVVSGDKDLLDLKQLEGIPILSPRDGGLYLGLSSPA